MDSGREDLGELGHLDEGLQLFALEFAKLPFRVTFEQNVHAFDQALGHNR